MVNVYILKRNETKKKCYKIRNQPKNSLVNDHLTAFSLDPWCQLVLGLDDQGIPTFYVSYLCCLLLWPECLSPPKLMRNVIAIVRIIRCGNSER